MPEGAIFLHRLFPRRSPRGRATRWNFRGTLSITGDFFAHELSFLTVPVRRGYGLASPQSRFYFDVSVAYGSFADGGASSRNHFRSERRYRARFCDLSDLGGADKSPAAPTSRDRSGLSEARMPPPKKGTPSDYTERILPDRSFAINQRFNQENHHGQTSLDR